MVLFINACARANSRTKKLAGNLIESLEDTVVQRDLYSENIPLLDEANIIARESAALKKDTTNRFVELASEFAQANRIIIAAPYWDMGYPAILRSYIEAIMVKGVTFTYDAEGNPIGLCIAREIIYVTTAGGPVPKPNYGYEHIKALAGGMIGIPKAYYFEAEGLDIKGADVDHILEDKAEELRHFSQRHANASYNRNTVLIVDDSKVNILKAEHILKENGFETLSALSGDACIKVLKTHDVDLILLDIEMPVKNGFETLDEIRANPKTSDIPVVFVTGDKTMDVVIKASKYNAAGYVTKPFAEEELLKHVRNGIGAN